MARLGARTVTGLVLVGALVAGPTGTASAVPPPPPNPSDSELQAAGAAEQAQAAQVGQLVTQLTEAQAQLEQLGADVELTMELANKALVDLQLAQDAAGAARAGVTTAQAGVVAAGTAIDDATQDGYDLAAASFEQGSTVGSLSAYLGSDSPEDVLARAEMLEALGSSQNDVVTSLERARTQQANAASLARAAQLAADAAEADAAAAQVAADTVRVQAQDAQTAQAGETARLTGARDAAQVALDAARAGSAGLAGQRSAFEAWDAQRLAEEEAARAAAQAQAEAEARAAEQRAAEARAAEQRAAEARAAQATPAAPASPRPVPPTTGGGGSAAPAPTGGSVQGVIDRALSQLGVRYSWGGGNASGPTVGIRDGGVADSFGDYRTVGFDCSGLMIYAFAGVRSLPHYSGYQYTAGRQVPIAELQPGDMVFYSPGGIHHVALYIGDGQMVEAPHSGSQVRIALLRRAGLMPYATRLL